MVDTDKPMRVAAYTGGPKVPSARMRVRQYLPYLRQYGIDLREHSLHMGKSMPRQLHIRPIWAAATLLQRSFTLPCSYFADVTLISRHMMPAFLPFDRMTKHPRVLDVDDAIWVNRGGQHAASLARSCDTVICGNHFLAETFSSWNRNIVLLPTPVDTELMRPARIATDGPPIIGWTGTSENLEHLYRIESLLSVVLQKHKDARLRIVADVPPRFAAIDSCRIEFIRWSEQSEPETIRTMTAGIMPLNDTTFARGKCSFKMLCYMASGVPVVVSPIGMNAEVLSLGDVGFGANTADEWIAALDHLLTDRAASHRIGVVGRRIAVKHFSLTALSPRLASALYQTAGRTFKGFTPDSPASSTGENNA